MPSKLSNNIPPTDIQKSVGVNLCLLLSNYAFLDRRGLSLQGKPNILMRTCLSAESLDALIEHFSFGVFGQSEGPALEAETL